MKHLSRPYQNLGIVVLVCMGAGVCLAPGGARAQSGEIVQLMTQEPSPALGHSSTSQGYLGVDVADLDQEKAQALKLKDVRGAVITLIDHDAPAGQIGLKVNDVVLQLNGQTVEGAEQLRRMLKEIPAGRKVSMEISRDGSIQTLSVELADRRVMEKDVWNKIGNGGDVFAQGTGMGILSGGGDEPLPGGFHMPFFGSTLNVGAMVEPLTSQMAEYLGVSSGLMVKQVAHKSEAATAGLKAFDVILKVGPEAITNLAGWDRALRANEGKPVQVTILRDKKQQTLTLQVDSKHKQGELEMVEPFGADDCPLLVAEIGPEFVQKFAFKDDGAAEALRDQAEALKEQFNADDLKNFKMDPKQMEQLKQQLDEALKNFKVEEFKSDDFKFDEKQMQQLKQQMDQFRKSFKPEDFKEFKFDQKQLDELKQQMEQMKDFGFGNRV
jgi:serine protease Do